MVEDLSFDSIDEVAASWLERDFEQNEVWEVVKAMTGDKTLSPDGYSMAFIQALLGCFERGHHEGLL